jgi:hypothetical protein
MIFNVKNIFSICLLMILLGCGFPGGYQSNDAFELSKKIPYSNPKRISILSGSGIDTKQKFDAELANMSSIRYSEKQDWDAFLNYLKDKKSSQESGKTIIQERDNRLAEERANAIKFPYIITVRCRKDGTDFLYSPSRCVGYVRVDWSNGNSRDTRNMKLSTLNGDEINWQFSGGFILTYSAFDILKTDAVMDVEVSDAISGNRLKGFVTSEGRMNSTIICENSKKPYCYTSNY